MKNQFGDEIINVDNVRCSKCGGNLFRESGIGRGLYICENIVSGKYCGNVMCYCKRCDKIYDESRFGKHGDVWVCKECDAINWACTDRKRATEEAKKLLSMVDAFKDSLRFKGDD